MTSARTPPARHPAEPDARPPTRAAGLLYGLGVGGFVDGIVLHQVLQWHHMVSDVDAYPTSTLAGLEANTLADGFFHTATLLFLLVASVLTVRAWQQGRFAPTWRFQLGLVVAGWGVFNLLDGVVDHQVLGVHHVRDDLGGPLSWDLGFLAVSALLLVGGTLVHRSGARALGRDGGGCHPGGRAPRP